MIQTQSILKSERFINHRVNCVAFIPMDHIFSHTVFFYCNINPLRQKCFTLAGDFSVLQLRYITSSVLY